MIVHHTEKRLTITHLVVATPELHFRFHVWATLLAYSDHWHFQTPLISLLSDYWADQRHDHCIWCNLALGVISKEKKNLSFFPSESELPLPVSPPFPPHSSLFRFPVLSSSFSIGLIPETIKQSYTHHLYY